VSFEHLFIANNVLNRCFLLLLCHSMQNHNVIIKIINEELCAVKLKKNLPYGCFVEISSLKIKYNVGGYVWCVSLSFFLSYSKFLFQKLKNIILFKNWIGLVQRFKSAPARFIFDVHNHLFLYSFWVYGRNYSCVVCSWLRYSEFTVILYICCLSIN
jgi:hypothetical protein